MKEDLIKVIDYKIKNVSDNIDNLNDLNEKIDIETNKLEEIGKVINLFKSDKEGYNIFNFSKIDRDIFNRLLMELDNSVLVTFGSNSCNYDGLIYLINGINSGISLTLTQEQTDAINLLIDKLLEKEKDYENNIAEFNSNKNKLEIKDIDTLNDIKTTYSIIKDKIDVNKYISDIEYVLEAVDYSKLPNDKIYDLLCYLLKYNSEIYNREQEKKEEIKKEEVHENKEEPAIDLTVPQEEPSLDLNKPLEIEDEVKETVIETPREEEKEEPLEEEVPEEVVSIPISLNDFSDSSYKPLIVTEENNDDVQDVREEEVDDTQEIETPLNEEINLPLEEEPETPISKIVQTEEVSLPVDNVEFEKTMDEIVHNEDMPFEFENTIQLSKKEIEENNVVDNDFNDFNKEDYVPETSNEVIDSEEFDKLLKEYGIKKDVFTDVDYNLLLKGDLVKYNDILEEFKKYKLINYLEKNSDVLVQILLYSNAEIIKNIESIVETDLSVDNSDSMETFNLITEDMPSVFINNDNGCYNNFINNIRAFKEYGINLISLFDFSKELFVSNTETIRKNYDTVLKYELTVNDKNAKYLLMLPELSTKMDYYVESVYKDKTKNDEVFDGINLIKLYPNKLNTVSDLTIKRLRYSSENTKKIFGSKEKSLSGEIANLKVDILNIPDEYFRKFFNNEFDIISRDEVETYKKLINDNRIISYERDNLITKLDNYKYGIRYNIKDINISFNKVNRIYTILVKNSIDRNKALLFAVCYNLIITKDEYHKLKSFINSLGGI